VAEVRASVGRIIEFPHSGSPGPDSVRRVYLDRFPFTLVSWRSWRPPTSAGARAIGARRR